MDTSEAAALPGVEAVFTSRDVIDDLGSLPRIPPRVSFDETVLPYLQPILAGDRIRYTGEPIAVVVAEDRYIAEDAAELVFADIDQLPAMLDSSDRPGAGEQTLRKRKPGHHPHRRIRRCGSHLRGGGGSGGGGVGDREAQRSAYGNARAGGRVLP